MEVGSSVSVAVADCVAVGWAVAALLGVDVAVAEALAVGVEVADGVFVTVNVLVAELASVEVRVGVAVLIGVAVGDTVALAVAEGVGVEVAVVTSMIVTVTDDVIAGEAEGILVAVGASGSSVATGVRVSMGASVSVTSGRCRLQALRNNTTASIASAPRSNKPHSRANRVQQTLTPPDYSRRADDYLTASMRL